MSILLAISKEKNCHVYYKKILNTRWILSMDKHSLTIAESCATGKPHIMTPQKAWVSQTKALVNFQFRFSIVCVYYENEIRKISENLLVSFRVWNWSMVENIDMQENGALVLSSGACHVSTWELRKRHCWFLLGLCKSWTMPKNTWFL